MWLFVFFPGLLYVAASIYDFVSKAIEAHREEYPNLNHLNYRNDVFVGRR